MTVTVRKSSQQTGLSLNYHHGAGQHDLSMMQMLMIEPAARIEFDFYLFAATDHDIHVAAVNHQRSYAHTDR